jgi:hypothetical protein
MRIIFGGPATPGSQDPTLVSGSLNWGRRKILRSGWCIMHDLGSDTLCENLFICLGMNSS